MIRGQKQLHQHGRDRIVCLRSNSTNIIPRLAEANPRIPAYLDSALAWGAEPVAVHQHLHSSAKRSASPNLSCPVSDSCQWSVCVHGTKLNTLASVE